MEKLEHRMTFLLTNMGRFIAQSSDNVLLSYINEQATVLTKLQIEVEANGPSEELELQFVEFVQALSARISVLKDRQTAEEILSSSRTWYNDSR